MRLSRISANINFGRNLTQEELVEYKKVLSEGKHLCGQTDKSIFIMPTSCLPQSTEYNSGMGHLTSEISQRYIDYMHNYIGFNVLEDLPSGQIPPFKNFYCAYNGGSFALGNHQINPELLATEEYSHLLNAADLKNISASNNTATKNEIVNFQNIMDNHGGQNTALQKAFANFKNLDDSIPLKQRYQKYIEENKSWLTIDRAREPYLDFFMFKQFLAEEHLKLAKDSLNKKGIKLCGDCLIGFSKDEVNAFPDAFTPNGYVGDKNWGLRALNYKEIMDDNSSASKLLKQKIQLFARRYDMIRFDVGWAYVTPKVTVDGKVEKIKLNSGLLEKIESWVKEVKGNDFDVKKNLIYEFDADAADFTAFDNQGQLLEPLRNRVKIYGNTYMHDKPSDRWGFNKAFLERGWSADEFVLGVGNHDPQPLRQIAQNIPEEVIEYKNGIPTIGKHYHKQDALEALAKIFNISPDTLINPAEFAKAKWAEPMMSKNNMMFFMDVFGREERFDMQWQNTLVHPEKNYAYKVPTDFAAAYQKSLKEGFGFNPMDALAKVFKVKGLDKSHPELYNAILKFNGILQEPEPIKAPVQKINKSGYLKPLLFCGAITLGVLSYCFMRKKSQSSQNKTQQKVLNPETSDFSAKTEQFKTPSISIDNFFAKIKNADN